MSTANSNSNSTLQDADCELNEEVDDESKVVAKAESKNEDERNEDEVDACTSSNFNASRTVFLKYNPESENDEEEKIFDQEKILDEITTQYEIEQCPIQIEETPPTPESDSNNTSNISNNDESNAAEEDEQQEETTRRRKDSDEESEYERPPRVRRCSSLKTGKTPPGTPGRKKIVRFADVLGLDLADVRTFLDDVPKIPKSAYEDLDVTLPSQDIASLAPPMEKVLVPLFQQPGCLPNFIDRLRDSQVCLESAAVTDPVNLTITGCARVRNLDFHKSVHIRYTLDNWRSYSDLSASYVENSCDGFSDKFSFILFGNSLQIGQRLEMAIRFQAKGEQFWDSNYGTNYSFQCLPCNTRASPIMSSGDDSTSLSSTEDSMANMTMDSNSSSSGGEASTHVDALGSRQWSNSFLY
jgi:protein phosphatase 1 regulatory subunit 3A/B/C/D/E